jgi:hypothetical protein
MKLIYFVPLLFPIIVSADVIPNPALTPGAIDISVTQKNLHNTVCVTGYTSTVRPGVNYTNKLKKQQIDEYQYTDKDMRHYEEDHLIPLAVGGHPSDPRNLWPQPWDGTMGARKKDVLEGWAHRALCSGKITLAYAQSLFVGDWTVNYHKLIK